MIVGARVVRRGVLAAVLGLVVAACGGGGASSPAPTIPAGPMTSSSGGGATFGPSGATPGTAIASVAPATTASATAMPKETPMAFTLTSTAFSEGGAIPKRYTCDGGNVSPALEWRGAPDSAAAFVLIVDDPDARGFVHWVLYDLTGAATGGLPEAVSESPDAPPQGTNSFGKLGYGGPCPPSGTHHYRFTLYALDAALGLSGAPKADAVRSAMSGHVVAETTLTGTYAR